LPPVNNLLDVHHANVIKFLHKAANNGYIIIYLTARPIDFDTQTRKYLFKALQNRDGGYSLPESPLFSGHKIGLETTESYNPSIIKATTIRLILDLFTLGEKVVYGAYGNKNTDAIAYTNSAILPERVYLIDENSCMTRLKDSNITSYEEHANNIDTIYPKIIRPI
jgi:phosphatidate phosphatase PAH1